MDIIDTIDLGTVQGFNIRAELVPDENQTLGDYSPTIVEAFDEGVCELVQMIVIASRAGTDLGSDSLGNVEYGTFPHSPTDWQHVDPLRDTDCHAVERRAEMIDNAVADARLKLTELIDAGIDGSME